MFLTTNLLRVLPSLCIRRPIRNRFVRSFLYYVPYVTLAVMTVPAIITAAGAPLAGAAALLVGLLAAWLGLGLLPVALLTSLTVYLFSLL